MKYSDIILGHKYKSLIRGTEEVIAVCFCVSMDTSIKFIGWEKSDIDSSLKIKESLLRNPFVSRRIQLVSQPYNSYVKNHQDFEYYISFDANNHQQLTLFESISSSASCVTKTHSIHEWQAWTHNIPGDCPCGIKRQDCIYHQ